MGSRMIEQASFRLAAAALCCAVLSCGGCGHVLVTGLVDAPNQGRSFESDGPASPRQLQAFEVDRELRVLVGPPRATLRVWVVEPDAIAMAVGQTVHFAATRPLGTVLVLHGYRNRGANLRGIAHALAAAGFRAVIVDLRGHGRSSGDYITYGVQESRDVVQVIDALERNRLLAGPVGVWGISMGGSTAIQAAARDRRIRTVVAVAPYSSVREVVPHFARSAMPVIGWFMSDQFIQARLDEAAARAGFDPDEADTCAAAAQLSDPILVIHGRGDWWVPAEQGSAVAEAAPPGSKLLLLDALGHVGVHLDVGRSVSGPSVEWFLRRLAPTAQHADNRAAR